MITIENGGPAFPVENRTDLSWPSGKPPIGMSIRDHFAGQTISAYIVSATDDIDWQMVARMAYTAADAMLAERSKVPVNPLQRELDEAKAQVAHLESLRPFWAKGFSSDSIAAQTTITALRRLWDMLGVSNQTMACIRLKELLAREPLV